jgi:phosphoribosylanthranilate isomerase
MRAMLKIKVCGMTDPGNVKEIAGTAPDLMGFIFYSGSKRYVGKHPDDALFLNVPSGILKTGVFVNEEAFRVVEIARLFRLGLVQLHGNETVDYCKYIKDKGLSIIKAFEINQRISFMSLEKYLDVCDYFLFDSKTGSRGGSGLKFDWEKIDEYDLNKPFFLGGGIGPEDICLIKHIKHGSLIGVDINSRFETRPGIKDAMKVQEFINKTKE